MGMLLGTNIKNKECTQCSKRNWCSAVHVFDDSTRCLNFEQKKWYDIRWWYDDRI